MPTYTLIPIEHDFEPEVLVATNAAQLLRMVYGFGWNAARVLQDGEYAFNVSLNPKGFWTIVQGLPDSDAMPTAASAKP